MTGYLTRLLAGVLITVWLLVSTALADHRPGNVVVIGGTLSLSGRYAEPVRRVLNGYKLYVDQLNARDGLLGHQVELRTLDDNSHRRTAIELYDKLINKDRVDLLLGPYSTPITDAVANVTERYQRPMIVAGTGTKAIWQRGRQYIFSTPVVIAQDRQNGALSIAKEIGVKRIAVIGEGGPFSRQVAKGVLAWAKAHDLEVVLLQGYHKGETDFTAILKKIEARGAQAIFSNGLFADTVAQLRQMQALQINVDLFSGMVGPALPRFVDELGSAAEFVLGLSQWEPKPVLGHPGMNAFIEAYEKRYGVKPNYHTAKGYAAMQVLEAAVNKAASFDPQKVRDALTAIAVSTVMGQWKADAQGLSTIEGLTFQIQNGKRVIVWPKQVAEAKYILPMPTWQERARH